MRKPIISILVLFAAALLLSWQSHNQIDKDAALTTPIVTKPEMSSSV